jgi:hypothetical protein
MTLLVMLRAGGASSKPQRTNMNTKAGEYWITRLRG